MLRCQNLISSIINPVKNQVTSLGKVAKDAVLYEIASLGSAAQNTEGLDKLAKFALGIIDTSKYAFGEVLIPFITPIKGFTELTGGLNLIDRISQPLGKDRPKNFLAWFKYVTLTIGHTADAIKFLHVIKLIDLGVFASKTCTVAVFGVSRVVPGLGTIKDISIGLSSIASIVINYKKWNDPNLRRRQEVVNFKIKKFKMYKKVLNATDGDTTELKNIANASAVLYRNYRIAFGNVLAPEKAMKKSCAKNQPNGERDDLSNDQKIELCNWNLDAWKKLKKLSFNDEKKAKMGIINDIFKLALVSMSLVAIFASPLWFVSGITIFGLLAGYTAYRKFCLDQESLDISPKPNFNSSLESI